MYSVHPLYIQPPKICVKSLVVPRAGLEPARPNGHQILSLACLPIPPPRPKHVYRYKVRARGR
jgi:hypothetical protein